MEGGDSEFANFTPPTLKAFLEARSQNVSGNKQQLVARAIGCPKKHFFPRTRDLLISQNTTQRHFFSILFSLSPVIFATATVMAFVLLRNSSFNFHCYTQREATPTQKSARKWRCDLSRLLARKITKGIYSFKPASLNRLIGPWLVVTPCRKAQILMSDKSSLSTSPLGFPIYFLVPR